MAEWTFKLVELVAPLLGVLLGALITGTGVLWRVRAERKKAIANALSDLLEVRHHVLAFETVLRVAKSKLELPAEVVPMLRILAAKLNPLDPEVHKRYSGAVAILAGIDPILAFQIRAKDTAPQLIDSFRALSGEAGIPPAELASLETAFKEMITPSLNEAILELARHHGWRTGQKVEHLIRSTPESPPELEAWLERVKSIGA